MLSKGPTTQNLDKPKLHICAYLFKDYPKQWIEWCKNGKLTGKPNTPRTIEIKESYFRYFLQRIAKDALKNGCSILHIAEAIGSYGPKSYSNKQKIYDTLMSFTAFLIFIGKLDPAAETLSYFVESK